MHPNASQPIYYDIPPNPLETLRMIQRSRPAIIRGTCDKVSRSAELRIGCDILTKKGKEKAWDLPEAYIDIMGDEKVSIAVTEDGLADSVQMLEEGGEEIFVKPLNEEMAMSDFMGRLSIRTYFLKL
jgi:jumonji domain-containing protein 7